MHRANLDPVNGRGAGVTLQVEEPRRPGLRVEVADGGRLMVRQSSLPLLFGRVGASHDGVRIDRRAGYTSVLPPLRSDWMRQPTHPPGTPAWYLHWAHRFAGWLASAAGGPLHEGAWLLQERGLPAYCWHGDLVTDWPSAYLDWWRGWNGVVPLRPLDGRDAGRVKAHRKHVRDGTLAPVLLWWVSGIDGYLLLDGHDRAVASLAEGVDPPCLVLSLGLDPQRYHEAMDGIALHYQRVVGGIERAVDAGHSGARRQLDAVAHTVAEEMASLLHESGRTRSWPLPGGAAAWDALAGTDPSV